MPECRAYELVTPPEKGSGEPQSAGDGEIEAELKPLAPSQLYGVRGARAAPGGDRVAWRSEPIPGAKAPGLSYLSTRTATGWSARDLVPPLSPLTDLLCIEGVGVTGWSGDLTKAILDLPAGPPAGFYQEPECGHDEPRLVAGEPEHFSNLFVHDEVAARTGSST